MKRRKYEIRNLAIVGIFIIAILLTNIQIFASFNFGNTNTSTGVTDTFQNLQISADPYLSDKYKTGSGDDQDMRLYVKNSSSSLNNEENFQIEAMSTTDTCYLSEGNFSFEFQNNYTTDYVLEDTGPLEAVDYIKFNLQNAYSSVNVETGNPHSSPNIADLTDNNNNTKIIIDDVSRVVSVNISANYTGSFYTQPSLQINVGFNRDKILGFLLSLVQSVSESAYLTIKIYDTVNSMWRNVTTQMFVNGSFGIQTIEQHIVNENLENIDLGNTCYIQLYYYGAAAIPYNVTLNGFKLPATYAFDLPINNQDDVALEFDLKGKSSTINGFYAWIRVLDQTEALNTQLEISLYKANDTMTRTQSQFLNHILGPETLIDSIIVKSNEFTGDTLNYFSFNATNTSHLPLYNYLIVIKSNNSNTVYSLETIPRSTFGDPNARIDHQLLATSDNATNWNLASISVPVSYTTETLDAALFKIGVTRGYMPSDFTNPEDEEDTLKIQDLPIENVAITSYPYNESSALTWGLGQWYHNFTKPIIDNAFNNFVIDLSWNKSIIAGFKFNVTTNAKAYWIEAASSFYNTSYTSDPEWQLNFTFSLSIPFFNNWDLYELWFIYPNYYSAHNLTNPNFEDIFDLAVNKTGGESVLEENQSYNRFILDENVTKNISGLYSLQLTSWNFLRQTDSFIHYDYMGVEALWESHGFMFGDNISVGLGVQGPGQNIPNTGGAEVKLFYPDTGIEVPGATLVNTTNGIQSDSAFYYDFNNATIYSVNETIPVLGNYYLGYFWNNGTAVSAKALKLYIDDYDAALNSLFYDDIENENILTGVVDKVFENYSILIGSVNITGAEYNPDFYPVNHSNLDIQYLYNVNGIQVPISLRNFMQNETILNPDEDINIKLQLQNNFELSDVKVQVKVQLVALANDNWIIDQQVSSVKTLKVKGDSLGRDIQTYSLNLTMPTLQSNQEWYGYNSPVRKGGVKTKVEVSILHDGKFHEIGIYESGDYAFVVNDTQDVFEGYLIALKYNTEKTGETIVKPFQREECNYLPEQSTFVINIFDKNYVSSYEQFNFSFSLKVNSEFSNVSINPPNPIRGEVINLTSRLTTEFGKSIPGKNITCQYYDNDEWRNISSQMSDSNAYTNFLINSLSLNDEDQLIFRLTWEGNSLITEKFQNVTVDLYRTVNEISAALQQNTFQIFKNQKSILKLKLSNTGNSELRITSSNITLNMNPELSAKIVQIDYVKLNQFKPGESTEILIEVSVSTINNFDITIHIEALNKITNENVVIQVTKNFLVYDVPIVNYLNTFFTLIIIGSILIIWAIIFLAVRRLIRKIEAPIEERVEKKPKRGRYVKVSELEEIPKPQEETPSKKVTKKKRSKKTKESEKDEDKSTDLDSLLEEEGLKDKK
ncbi:MAG: hypothetical protein P8Y23_01030 [Candidatus Lokiarchaeota archaeon]